MKDAGNKIQLIENKVYDEERALYHLRDTEVKHCTFTGPQDGESVLKESRNIKVVDSKFSLRYPMWHNKKFELLDSTLDELTRAPLWYDEDGLIDHVTITSVKAIRECHNIVVKNSHINSDEFGWKSHHIKVDDSTIHSEYLFLDSSDITVKNLEFVGKYSFQYTENLTVEDSFLDTKDAFWHSKNVVVRNCLVKGEYLGWFSDGLTLINCKIMGTQPLCYCKNLKLINCTMEETDLAFEYSEVEADVKGDILSVKNPKSGKIVADSIGKIIKEGSIMEDTCDIIIQNNSR